MKKLTAYILFLFCAVSTFPQGLRTKGKLIVDKNGNEVILRGIGLGGWMLQEPYMLQLSGIASTQQQIKNKITQLIGEEQTQKFYEAWLSSHCTRADIDSLAAWGFNSVRLPMHYNLFTLSIEKEPVPGKQTWLQKGFDLTDSLLSWCKANKIYLVLDLHAAPGGQGNDIAIADRDTSAPALWQSELNKQKTIALWEKFASRYAGEEWLGGYDVINEPNWGFMDAADKNGCAETMNQPLKDFLQQITSAIRRVDKTHMIIIEGNCWGNNYNGMFPLWDDNMVISFHKYWNYTDKNSIQRFLDYRDRYNIPVWMGESGENSNSWFTDAIILLEQNKIGWAWWPLKKMGINNPLQVKINPGYLRILNYWKGKGEKPSAEEAFTALMQLANDTKLSNNIVHRDVIDAMRRQVHSSSVLPFNKNTIDQQGVIFAVDYDFGRMHQAYYDKDSGNYWVSTNSRTNWNKGWQYRNDGVDIEASNDEITNGYHVGWTEAGEWLRYSVYANREGNYSFVLRYAAKDSSGEARCIANDNGAAVFNLPATGSYTSWQNSSTATLKLKQGWNDIRIFVSKGGFNLNYFRLSYLNSTANINSTDR